MASKHSNSQNSKSKHPMDAPKAMKILGFPISKCFNDLDMQVIQHAFKTTLRNRHSRPDPNVRMKKSGSKVTDLALINDAYQFLIRKYVSDLEERKKKLDFEKSMEEEEFMFVRPETSEPTPEELALLEAQRIIMEETQRQDEKDRLDALMLAQDVVQKGGLELPACQIIQNIKGNQGNKQSQPEGEEGGQKRQHTFRATGRGIKTGLSLAHTFDKQEEKVPESNAVSFKSTSLGLKSSLAFMSHVSSAHEARRYSDVSYGHAKIVREPDHLSEMPTNPRVGRDFKHKSDSTGMKSRSSILKSHIVSVREMEAGRKSNETMKLIKDQIQKKEGIQEIKVAIDKLRL